jgi:hypothetical protein
MKSGPQIALAVGIGYALGRSRKMKFAITVGAMMAGRRLTLDPKDLLAQGGKLLGGSTELRKLTGEARDRLMDAAKTAAMAAATNKIDSIGENLSKRAASVRAPRLKDQGLGELSDGLPGGASRADEEPDEERSGEDSSRSDDRDRERTAEPSASGRSGAGASSQPGGGRRRTPVAKDVPEPRSSGRTGSRSKSAATSRNESGTRSRSPAGSSRGD